jgi:hypothetical protein
MARDQFGRAVGSLIFQNKEKRDAQESQSV